MKLFDFERKSQDQNSVHFQSKHLSSLEEKAETKRSLILSTISNLSVDPKRFVLGYDYEPEDPRQFFNCLPEEIELHRQRLHSILHNLLQRYLCQISDSYNLFECCHSIPKELKSLPPIPAIYFCIRREGCLLDEEIWYIGKTTNLNSRWKSHHKQSALESVGATWLYFQPMIGVSNEDISLLERLYILMFEPVFNDKLVFIGKQEEEKETYKKGFEDGYEKATEDAIKYFSNELSRLHAQIFNLQSRLSDG